LAGLHVSVMHCIAQAERIIAENPGIDPKLIKNLNRVLYELDRIGIYLRDPTPLADGHVCVRDDECLSIEWPSRSLFCCIYTESVALDRVITCRVTNTMAHNEETIPWEAFDARFQVAFAYRWL
jgi:hypothetical protein